MHRANRLREVARADDRRLAPTEGEELLDDAGDAIRLTDEQARLALDRGVGMVEERRGAAGEHLQRRADLVGEPGRELADRDELVDALKTELEPNPRVGFRFHACARILEHADHDIELTDERARSRRGRRVRRARGSRLRARDEHLRASGRWDAATWIVPRMRPAAIVAIMNARTAMMRRLRVRARSAVEVVGRPGDRDRAEQRAVVAGERRDIDEARRFVGWIERDDGRARGGRAFDIALDRRIGLGTARVCERSARRIVDVNVEISARAPRARSMSLRRPRPGDREVRCRSRSRGTDR